MAARKYQYVVEQTAFEQVMLWPDEELQRAARALARLADQPNLPPDLELPGFGGRRVSLHCFGSLTVPSWDDVPVKEIRIVAIARR
jgi:hypothetical protein